MTTPFKPLSEFSHLAATPINGNNFWKVIHLISQTDFKNGLDPFEPSVMQIMKGFRTGEAFNLFNEYCTCVLMNKKNFTPQDIEFMSHQIQQYQGAGIFQKKHVLDLVYNFARCDQKMAVSLMHDLIAKKVIDLSDKIPLIKSPWDKMNPPVMAPLIFSVDARYAENFFQKYGAQSIAGLSFEVNESHLKGAKEEKSKLTAVSLKRSPIIDIINYLSFAQKRKEKNLLDLCVKYLGGEKEKSEKLSIEKIFSFHTPTKQKFDLLKKEIKQQNTMLPRIIDDIRLKPLLAYEEKDIMMIAIEAKHTALIEKLMTMDFFQRRKSYLTSLQESYVGFAANRSSREIEKLLIDNEFYHLDNFGKDYRNLPVSKMSIEEKNLSFIFHINTPKLSDDSMAKIMGFGYEPSPESLISSCRRQSYLIYLKRNSNLSEDSELMARLNALALDAYRVQNSIVLMILDTMGFLRSQSQPMRVQALEKNLLKGIKAIPEDGGTKAQFVIGAYLKYFPEKKESFLSSVSDFGQNWARRFERQNIDSTLKDFLISTDAPSVPKVITQKYKI